MSVDILIQGLSGMGLFGTRIFLFHGRIGMGTFIFWHMDILAKYIHLLKCLGAEVSCVEMSMSHKIPSAKTVLYQNVHKCQNVCAKMSTLLCKVPKYPCADMFRCQNISVPNSPCVCQNVHGDEMSMCQYGLRAKTYTRRNVLVMKCPC